MKVRPYQPEDAAALADLFVRSVQQLGCRDYSPAQVEAWAARGPSPERVQALSEDGRTTLVAVDDDDRPLAYGDLEADGHIDFLYASPESAGTGAAAAVYEQLEKTARDQGLTRLYAEASEAARRFFTRRAFLVTAERRFEVSGVPIHNYAVEKSLRQTP